MSTPVGPTTLLRAALRRDRVLLSAWVAVLVGMVAASAFAVADLYPDVGTRTAATRLINTSPALVALYGPILNESSPGELAMSKMTVMYAMAVMGLAVVLVRRHTRGDEESGRTELVGATLVARDAPLRAAVLEGLLASVALGVLAALIDLSAGLPVAGSVAFGPSWVGIGLVGTGLAAVCCQLSASTRTCGGIAVAVVGGWYVLRAAGDTGPDVLGWLSPLGWGTRLDAWGSTRWWVLGLYGLRAALLGLTAQLLHARRDLGSGLLAERSGPRDGRIGSVPGLVWRLIRTVTGWWLLAGLVWGALFGSIAPHLGSLFDSPAGRAALEALGGRGRVQETMLTALLAIMAALLTAYGLQVVVIVGHDEVEGRSAAVLAADGSRARLFWWTVGLALAGTALLAVSYGVGSAIGFGTQVDGVSHSLARIVPAALAHVPATWVVLALSILAWAVRPTLTWVGWALLLGFVTVGELGPLLRLPDAAAQVSPYQHVAKVPVQPVDWPSEAGLLAVTAVVLAAAWWRYRSRDIG